MNKQIVITGGIIGLTLTLGVWAYTRAESAEIQACINKAGMPRIVESADQCRKGETLLTWNKQGLQGEKGEKGDKGDRGEQGLQGEKGKDGLELHLFDGNGQDLGVFLGADNTDPTALFLQGGFVHTYWPALDAILRFRPSPPDPAEFSPPELTQVRFSDFNCSGESYIEQPVVGSHPQFKFFKLRNYNGSLFQIGNHTTEKTWSSVFEEGHCSNGSGQQPLPSAYIVEPATLPFSEPIAWPLQVKPL